MDAEKTKKEIKIPPELEIRNLAYSYEVQRVVKDISFRVEQGEFAGLIGPNGSGKSTILKMIYRALMPERGEILLAGKNIQTMSHRESAQKMAVVGQENETMFDFSVEEIVAMGRSPYKTIFDIDLPHDRNMVRHALNHMGMEDMAKRNYLNLSGGEKQRTLIARAIAQESKLFVLDEPTNHLDISYQMEIFDLIRKLKVTVLAAMHDLNLASVYCDKLYCLKKGEIIMCGTPEEILTVQNIYDLFGVRCSVEIHPVTGRPAITYLPDNK